MRLFYEFLVNEGLRESNPLGRGRYVPSRARSGTERGLVPSFTKLPWIPSESQWLDVLAIAANEPIRNRVMLALAYDAVPRREKLRSLRQPPFRRARYLPPSSRLHERTDRTHCQLRNLSTQIWPDVRTSQRLASGFISREFPLFPFGYPLTGTQRARGVGQMR